MAQVSLNEKQIKSLVDSDAKKFGIAKDHGAYVVGFNPKGQENVVCYFRGMHPDKNDGWWEKCSDVFGGDDFGEDITDIFAGIRKDKRTCVKFIIKVSPANFNFELHYV